MLRRSSHLVVAAALVLVAAVLLAQRRGSHEDIVQRSGEAQRPRSEADDPTVDGGDAASAAHPRGDAREASGDRPGRTGGASRPRPRPDDGPAADEARRAALKEVFSPAESVPLQRLAEDLDRVHQFLVEYDACPEMRESGARGVLDALEKTSTPVLEAGDSQSADFLVLSSEQLLEQVELVADECDARSAPDEAGDP